jgi:hypothetical protein
MYYNIWPRIKQLFREYLKIARDIPFTHIYRFTTANADPNEVSTTIYSLAWLLCTSLAIEGTS